MSKVITFSRTLPAYHINKGQPTYFVEKFYNSIYEKDGDWSEAIDPDGTNTKYVVPLNHHIRDKKHHTIRAGNRWKVGDYFSPRVWSVKPYTSKQIIIAPDIQIKKIWEFELLGHEYFLHGHKLNLISLQEIAKNDGLTSDELELWFQKPFKGQVICWNEGVNY